MFSLRRQWRLSASAVAGIRMMPSLQLARYLQERANGKSVEEACFWSGIGRGEAELHEADIASGELELPRARAPAREGGQSGEEMSMEDVQTSIRVNDGPEVPIDLKKDINDPANAGAKEAISGMFEKPATDTGQRLKLYIERAERLDDEIKDLNSDKSELFQEMKSNGFDTKTVKRIIKLRKMEPHARQEAEALLQTYMNAIGMTPIEQAIALAA
jgi:uncharacterized protein (UPF0335 family)